MKKNKKNKIESGLLFKKHRINQNVSDDAEIIDKQAENVTNELDYNDEILEIEDGSDIRDGKLSDDDIENNLKEIYSDGHELPDFTTIKIKKKRGFGRSLFYTLIILLIFGFLAYGVINYIKNSKDNSSVLGIEILAPVKVSLGEEFFYEINYNNSSNYNLQNINLEINYPENFIILDVYSVDKNDNNKTWYIGELGAKMGGKIKIKGKIINREGLNNLLSVKANYEISGLSSHFNKDSFSSISIGQLPFQVYDDYFSTVLIGEEYPLKLNIKNFPFEQVDNFIISFSGPENIFNIEPVVDKNNKNVDGFLEKVSNNNFKVNSSSTPSDLNLDFKYKLTEKKNDQEIVTLNFKYVDESGKEFIFYEKQLKLELIKSDLHLNILLNESSNDFPVNFGDKLDYVIKYSNQGDKQMKDIVIMAVLDSDFLDWKSLSYINRGVVSRKTISWTFRELPELRELNPGEGGEIKFSINVANFNKLEFGQKLEIKSYAQFSIGNIDEFKEEEDRLTDNRSNIVINPINSDLSIKEEVLYFDEDNIPVGSGPLPPVVGEKTSFRYYWTLKNTLHELRDVKVELPLPAYVIWDNDYNVGAGGISFDSQENKVIFNISRWPLGVDTVKVNFKVSIIPTNAEYNKIIILSSGSNLEAFDIETNALISRKTNVKTSKLEDDTIAAFSNDGRVK